MQRQIALGLVVFREDETEPPFRKAHLRPVSDETNNGEVEDLTSEGEDELATQVRGTYFYKQSQVTVKYLRELMGKKVFDNPKDHEEIGKLIRYVCGSNCDGIVLDFFAGSGTTAEAVLRLRLDGNSTLKFILVQLPEPCNPKERTGKAALDSGLSTVVEITKERIRRSIKKVEDARLEASRAESGEFDFEPEVAGAKDLEPHVDLGFRVFKLDQSNFDTWNANVERDAKSVERQLDLHIDHIRDNRTPEDILYELLLKSGFPLTTPVEQQTIEGKTVYSIAGGALMICLDGDLTLELIRSIAELKPERFVFLDEGFAGNDQLKANAVQTFKTKGVASFRTV